MKEIPSPVPGTKCFLWRDCRALVGEEPIGPGGRIGWHLSVSCAKRLPTWDELKHLRYELVPDAAMMAMVLPPKAEYVNVHPFTFHLFQTWDHSLHV